MALVIPGKTPCVRCGIVIAKEDQVVSFPAFLPHGHALSIFSDAVFHRECFDDEPRSEDVSKLYDEYRLIMKSRPKGITNLDEIDSWGIDAFKDFPPR